MLLPTAAITRRHTSDRIVLLRPNLEVPAPPHPTASNFNASQMNLPDRSGISLMLAATLALLLFTQRSNGQVGAGAAPSLSAKSGVPPSNSSAQSANSGGPAPNFRSALDDAKRAAKGHDIAKAEQSLTAFSKFKSNTPHWDIETCQALVQVANELSREGSSGSVPAVAAQALQHLNRVDNPATDAKTRARAKAIAGYIQERYTGDPAGAIASYQASLQLDPNDAASKEALERLQRADANLRAKIHPPKH
jgi:hypothetical protein